MRRSKVVRDVLKAYGGAAALAAILGVSRQAVWQWDQIPLKYVRQIAKDTKIPRSVLRPDIYGR
jgi:DNA-binding transcriptional regulator YdaS (Cro superfamily)